MFTSLEWPQLFFMCVTNFSSRLQYGLMEKQMDKNRQAQLYIKIHIHSYQACLNDG